jgi:hypothetical protein
MNAGSNNQCHRKGLSTHQQVTTGSWRGTWSTGTCVRVGDGATATTTNDMSRINVVESNTATKKGHCYKSRRTQVPLHAINISHYKGRITTAITKNH